VTEREGDLAAECQCVLAAEVTVADIRIPVVGNIVLGVDVVEEAGADVETLRALPGATSDPPRLTQSSLNRSPCIRAHSYLRQLLSIGRFSLQDFSIEGFPSVKKNFLDVSSRITAQHARRAPVAGRARPTADPYVSS
jgi:hypothetical protein